MKRFDICQLRMFANQPAVRQFFVMAVAAIAIGPAFSFAQDEAKKSDAAAPADEWAKLITRRDEIKTELATIRTQFSAPDADRRELANKFTVLVNEFSLKVEPRLTELAEERFNKDSKDVEAGEFFLAQLYKKNRFSKAVEVGDKLLTAGKPSPFVRNTTGLAHFAVHNFSKAIEVLEAARKDGDLDPEKGKAYLEYAGDYVELWEQEQKIRKAEAAAPDAEKNPTVMMKTSKGDIEIELFENEAPNTVANYIELIESKKYDGVKFHRVIPGFMIQGGDPNSIDDDPSDDGQGGPGYTIKCECHTDKARMHFAGCLSMAHAGRDTGGSQFFITHLPTPHLNRGMSGFRPPHTCFGRVTKGMDAVAAMAVGDKIESVKVIRKRDHEYKAEKVEKKSADEPKKK